MAALAPADRRLSDPVPTGEDGDPGSAAAEGFGTLPASAPPPEAATGTPTTPQPMRPARRARARSGNAVAPASVTAMFDEIAPVYDRVNTVMTLGLDARWRRAAVDAAAVLPGGAAIDVACGTGKLAAALAERVGPFGRVVGVDLSTRMIERGSDAFHDVVQLEFRPGDALALPARDGEFDAATIAFGLRNLSDFGAGLRELRRVVRPGGRVVCLELTMPRPAVWGRTFHAAFRRLVPVAGRVAGRSRRYGYLPASLEGYPDAETLAGMMRATGLTAVSVRRLALGSVALHVGTVPSG